MEFKTNNVNETELVYSLLREKYPARQIEIEYNDNTKEYLLTLTDKRYEKIGILLIKNKNKEIKDICLVDNIYYKELKKYSWCKSNKYFSARVDGKTIYLHRYILSVLCKKEIENKVIDHLDNNPSNNQINNLKICTFSENNHNLSKALHKSSKFMGVSYDEKTKKYRTQKNTGKETLNAYFQNEHHAAHQYNLWCKEHGFLNNLNIIDEKYLKDFKPYDCKKLPYKIKPRKINVNQEIKRNNDNIAIIELFNNKKEKVGEVLLDDNLYTDLIKFSWHKNDSGYAVGSKTTSKKRMHRYIFEDILKQNIPDNFIVDHINNNRLDNRLENLRIVSKTVNACNLQKQNGSSKYIGITKLNRKKSIKWSYQLNYNGNHITAVFETEEEAMIARNNYINENNLPHKLN